MGDQQAKLRYTWGRWFWISTSNEEPPRDVEADAGELYWKWLTEKPLAGHVEMSDREAAEPDTTGDERGHHDEAVAGQELSSRPRFLGPAMVLRDSVETDIHKEIDKVRGSQELPSIWRVHPSLREQESGAYDPKLVSIGPLHHGKEGLLPMEELKVRYLDDLLRRSSENSLGNYVKAMRDCQRRARMQYAEEIKLTEDEFVRMLVIDGCFIVEYFLKMNSKETREKARLTGIGWGFAHLQRDLMLLENQIPFFVLVKLFEHTAKNGTSPVPTDFMEVALLFLNVRLPVNPKADDVLHLLHLHHLSLNPSLTTPDQSHHCSPWQLVLYPFRKTTSLILLVFFSLLDFMFSNRKPAEVPRMIPSVTELHGAGVKFKKVAMMDGVNCYLKVAFREGTMEIPFLCVEESTSSKLRNFIALEQCCPKVGSHFTSYGVFMDNIINTEDDVAVLRKHGIIACNNLGCDEDVAKMFNTLCKGTHLNYDQHDNSVLFKEVKDYCEFTHHRWRAILERKYFSNPWSIISLLAGIILLSLAAIQTYFTVFPRR